MERPIFVVGAARSGTTLLRLILDSHPNVAVPEETGFMRAVEATLSIPDWKYGPGWYERLGIDEGEFLGHLRHFYSGLFEQYAARQGKQRWGEKTPFHTGYVDQIAAVFPDAVFVGIVRHPAAVANSLVNRWGYHLDDAVGLWRDKNLMLLNHAARQGTRFALCRYEDLVRQPEQTLRALMAFLDEPWSEQLLAHHAAQRGKGAPRTVDGGTRPRDPIDAARASGWADMLTDEQVTAIRDGVGGLAAFLGYDVDSVATLGSLCGADPGASHQVVRGDELGTLLRRDPLIFDLVADIEAQTSRPSMSDLTREQLEERLIRTEKALERLRNRRAVLIADALNRIRRANSMGEVRHAVRDVRVRKYK